MPYEIDDVLCTIYASSNDLRGGPIGQMLMMPPNMGTIRFYRTNLHNITLSEADNGMVDYYCFYFRYTYPPSSGNPSPLNVSASIYPYVDHTMNKGKLEIGLGSSGINGVEQIIPNIYTAPSGVVFSNSINITLDFSQHHAFWIKRTIRPKYFAYEFFEVELNWSW